MLWWLETVSLTHLMKASRDSIMYLIDRITSSMLLIIPMAPFMTRWNNTNAPTAVPSTRPSATREKMKYYQIDALGKFCETSVITFGIIASFCSVFLIHYSDVREASQRLKSQAYRMFIQQLVQTITTKTSKLHIPGPLWLLNSPRKGPVTWKAFPCHGFHHLELLRNTMA